MPRSPRIDLPGAVQHVTSRGNRRQTIFHDDHDRRFFLRELERAVKACRWHCLAYCLMGNHYHLVLETPEPNLGIGMRNFLSRFVRETNRRHGTDGHLFKERYHSTLVGSDEHFACLLRYVALNPVKDGFCSDPLDWPWSSHTAHLRGEEGPLAAVGRVDDLLSRWGGREGTRYSSLLAPFGPFGEWRDATSPLPPRPSLEALFASLPADAAFHSARWEHGYRVTEIARHVGLSESVVSRRTRRS